jgi:amidase
MDKLHWKSATEIARLIREKKVTASDVLEHFLARVDRFNPKLNAIIWQDRDRARKRAILTRR